MRRDSVRTLAVPLSACLLLALPIQALATTVSFEPGDLAAFQLNGGHASNLSIVSGAGIGGGSGLTSTSTGYATDSAILASGAAMTADGTYTTSIFYRMALQGMGPDLRLGFVTDPSTPVTEGPGNPLWFETYGGSAQKSWSASFGGFIFGNVEMTPGDWFRLEVTLQSLGGADFSLSATLGDYGVDGTAFLATLFDESTTFQSASLASAPTVYAGFHAFGDTLAFDEFAFQEGPAAAVPVPAAGLLALPLLGLAGLAARRRRRAA